MAKLKVALFVVVFAILYIVYQQQQTIKSFDDVSALNELSDPFREVVLNAKNHVQESFRQPWLVVKVTSENTIFYSNVNQKNTYKLKADYNPRLKTVHKFISKIQRQSKKKLPDGEYIISLRENLNYASTYPILSFSSMKQFVQQRHIVLMPDPDAMRGYEQLFATVDQEQYNFAWQSRKDKIFWRGPATGYNNPNIKDIYTIPRIKFMTLVKDLKYVDAGFSSYTTQWPAKYLPQIKQSFPLQKQETPQLALGYRYLINIDGNGCTYAPMAFILYSQSLLLKTESDHIQWYYHKLRPYVHYLPIAADFSDLASKYVWAQQHQTEDRVMANNANKLAAEVFNNQAIIDATIDAFEKYNQLVHQLK